MRHLRESGIAVFDQTPLENNFLRLWEKWKSDPANATSEYCWPIPYDVYRPIFLSGVIGQLYFLPGWDKSVGSAWERSQGLAFRVKILDYPEHLYRKILEEHNLVSA